MLNVMRPLTQSDSTGEVLRAYPTGAERCQVKYLHVIAGMEGVNGLSATVAFFARTQERMGDAVTIATLWSDGTHDTGHARIVEFKPSFPRFVCFSWQMLRGLGKLVREVDVVWVHSSWTFPVWFASFLAKWYKKKLVLTPNGCFDPVRLRKSRWKKRLAAPIDRWCLRQAAFVQAACREEVGWIKTFEPRVRDVKEIPLGVEVPETVVEPSPHMGLRLLFLGRIHHLKGIDLLVEAMKRFAATDVSLTIAGVNEEQTVEKLGDLGGVNIQIIPPVFGADKTALINEHDALVLPSRTESYGIVVAEALAQARPVIVSTEAPWEDVKTRRCGWFVEPSVDALVRAIRTCRETPRQARLEMGLRGRRLIEEKYSSRAIGTMVGRHMA